MHDRAANGRAAPTPIPNPNFGIAFPGLHATQSLDLHGRTADSAIRGLRPCRSDAASRASHRARRRVESIARSPSERPHSFPNQCREEGGKTGEEYTLHQMTLLPRGEARDWTERGRQPPRRGEEARHGNKAKSQVPLLQFRGAQNAPQSTKRCRSLPLLAHIPPLSFGPCLVTSRFTASRSSRQKKAEKSGIKRCSL